MMNPLLIAFAIAAALGIASAPDGTPDAAPRIVAGAAAQTPAAPGKGQPAAPAETTYPATARTPETQIATGRFTTALEVKPILSAIRPQWVGLREYDGQDLLYFTNLAGWRCGLWEVRYGVNGAAPDTALTLEPCHDDTAQPNGITDPVGYPIFFAFPPDSVASIAVAIAYDDGTTDAAVYGRAAVLMP